MRTILVLGAGQSTPFLIRYLLERASEGEWRVEVGDRRLDVAQSQIDGHPRGSAVEVDAMDDEARRRHIAAADLVVNLLPPRFQVPVAEDCVAAGRSMVSASYRNRDLLVLEDEARSKGLSLLTELGLDPGIDLMSAMSMLDRLRSEGAQVESFESYGSGVPAPESISNPLAYAVTWNPWNVAMAARRGAQFLRDGKIKVIPWHRVFDETWPVEVGGVGTMIAYPNRDSLDYRESFGLPDAHTLIRGTLRHPGFCDTWHQLVRLGLPNEDMRLPRLGERTFRELTEAFLPPGLPGGTTEERTAAFLGLEADDERLARLRWLGIFDDETIDVAGETPAHALAGLLSRKLELPPGGRDMVVLLHELEVRYPADGDRRRRITSTLVEKGEPDGITAMARTVGLPAGTAARLLLEGRLSVLGCPLPTSAEIYEPMLQELARDGVAFEEAEVDLSP